MFKMHDLEENNSNKKQNNYMKSTSLASATTVATAKKMQSSNNNSTLATTTTMIALPKAQHANANSNKNNAEDISGGVQDTIYLCNFRVSVDGEWLCLKELQDLDIQDGSSSSGGKKSIGIENNRFDGDGFKRDLVNYYCRDPAAIERSNLVNICKLVVKELLEQSLRFGRMLDSDHLPLQHFFIVLEHVLRHGLRPKKGLLGPKKELWDLLQCVEKYCVEAQDITASVRDLPTVRTHMGRARAWLRIALMQKKLGDYLQALIEHRDEILVEYYEPHALMMSDEVIIIMGILIGLNVIDCNLCVKEEDLDSQQGVIDFSLYLRTSSRASPEDEGNMVDGPEGNMTTVLDQKNYIEELNRHLNATVANLQAKVEGLTTTNALMKEDLAIARNSLLALQAENQALRQNIQVKSQNQNTPTHAITNSDNNSDSSQNKNSESLAELTEQLAEEKKKNNELEKELRLQVSLKAETDMAMKLLEKDIHEKQDTIISLRRQLEDIKQINLEMYKKLQECEASVKHKTELLSKLESQKEDMANAIQMLEKKWNLDRTNLTALQDASKALSYQATLNDQRAARAEADVRIEREWRISLQDKEIKLKEQINNLQSYVQKLTEENEKNEKVKIELEKLRKQWQEAQTTLEELGIQLSVSKLKVSELQEKVLDQKKMKNNDNVGNSISGSGEPNVWTPDNATTKCKGCDREFSMTRRRHHCRSCGSIFCNTCSEHTISLSDENGKLGKAVRVCDNCWDILNASRSK